MAHHIDHYYDEALSSLKQQILLMGTHVERMLADCMLALKTRDRALSAQVVEADRVVDALEVAIDEQCIELLARYQPAAGDLRFITRGLKIVTDLERIADLAVNVAERVIDIIEHGVPPLDLSEMTEKVQEMVKESLAAFIGGDVAKAEQVLAMDDAVDDLTTTYVEELLERSTKEPEKIQVFFPASSIVRYLERISDHATNIAELVIFMVKGKDVRHQFVEGSGK